MIMIIIILYVNDMSVIHAHTFFKSMRNYVEKEFNCFDLMRRRVNFS